MRLPSQRATVKPATPVTSAPSANQPGPSRPLPAWLELLLWLAVLLIEAAEAISAAIPAAMVVGGSSQQRPQPLFAAAADQPLGSLLLRPALAPAIHGRQPQKRPRECGA
jgi:hypothetical protein